MRHRINKIKREHSVIDGGLKFLTELAKNTEVVSIIPGPIKKSRSYSKLQLFYQYKTNTGHKYLLKGNGVVQEVFLTKKALQKDILVLE